MQTLIIKFSAKRIKALSYRMTFFNHLKLCLATVPANSSGWKLFTYVLINRKMSQSSKFRCPFLLQIPLFEGQIKRIKTAMVVPNASKVNFMHNIPRGAFMQQESLMFTLKQ